MESETSGLLASAMTAILSMLGVGHDGPPVSNDGPAHVAEVVEMKIGTEALLVAPDEVNSVEAVLDPQIGQPQVHLVLNAEAAAWMGRVTAANVGEVMDVSVCHLTVLSPTIQTPIPGGSIVISGAFTHDEVEALAQVIAGRISCEAFLAEGHFDGN